MHLLYCCRWKESSIWMLAMLWLLDIWVDTLLLQGSRHPSNLLNFSLWSVSCVFFTIHLYLSPAVLRWCVPNPVHKFINIFGTLESMFLCIMLLTGSPQNEIIATRTVLLTSCLRTRLHLLQRTVEVVSLLVDVHRCYSLQGLLADHGSSLAYAMVCMSTYVTLMCCG